MTNCIACGNMASPAFSKGGVEYHHCFNCNTYFVEGGLPQSGKIGGKMEWERNVQQNSERISRILTLAGGKPQVMDYGCGHGFLVAALLMAGHSAFGYDKFNPQFDVLPMVEGCFDICMMVEVIEHLTHPWKEISDIHGSLKVGGVLYIESSFSDLMGNDIENTPYVEPSVGHCSILSHKGLDRICIERGLVPGEHINGNVRIYRKVPKIW